MKGETNLIKLIKEMQPVLNSGEYVFSTVESSINMSQKDILCEFKEKEGISVVIEKKIADKLKLHYDFIASWITLEVHSSLDAVGLSALISTELAKHTISCNIIAGFFHDHIFVAIKDGPKAIKILVELSNSYN